MTMPPPLPLIAIDRIDPHPAARKAVEAIGLARCVRLLTRPSNVLRALIASSPIAILAGGSRRLAVGGLAGFGLARALQAGIADPVLVPVHAVRCDETALLARIDDDLIALFVEDAAIMTGSQIRGIADALSPAGQMRLFGKHPASNASIARCAGRDCNLLSSKRCLPPPTIAERMGPIA